MDISQNEFFKPVIGITLGDAAGIGAEVVCKAVAAGLEKNSIPVIIDNECSLLRGMQRSRVSFPYRVIRSIGEAGNAGPIPLLPLGHIGGRVPAPGLLSPENGRDEGELLVRCIALCQQGGLNGFCFAPLNKAALKAAGFNFPSEHEMFAHYYGQNENYGEMNYVNGLWNIRVTSHIPLKDVCKNITVDKILATARLGFATLRRAGCEKPRIAVAALNPHEGEHGTCGMEEIEVIRPAIQAAAAEGMPLLGPFSSDTLFLRAFKGNFDGVITMYHDQGQIAIKLQDFMHCVTVSAGLPHPITTPAHGTAYDIAGTGTCSSVPFENAYRICCRMANGDFLIRKKNGVSA